VIVGSGSLGILFGVKLARKGFPVAMQVKTAEMAKAYERTGIILMEGRQEIRSKPFFFPAGSPPTFPPKAVLIAVKAYDTLKALSPLLSYIPEGVPVLTLQNGLSPPYQLREALGPFQVFLGVTQEGARRSSFNVSIRSGRGRTWIGSPFANIVDIPEFISDLKEAGFDVIFLRDIWPIFWKKLIVSISLNPLTALSGLPNGGILKNHWGEKLLWTIVEECLPYLKGMGLDFGKGEAFSFIRETIEKTRDNHSSMLQDIERGRRTEIEEIAGEFVKRAKERGYKTPVVETLLELIRWQERKIGIASL